MTPTSRFPVRDPLRPPAPRPHLLGSMAALAAVTIWGLTFVPSKLALAEMGPFTLAVLRFGLALAVALAVASRLPPEVRRLRGIPWRDLALLGFTGVALYYGLQNLGLARTSATDAGLISGSVPVLTAALSAVVLRERVSALRATGIAASMVGVAAVVLAQGAGGGGGSVAGDLLMLGAYLAWACYTLLNKRLGGQMPETLLLAATIAFGTLFLLPPAGLEVALAGFGPVSPLGWLCVLFLGLGGSGAAFFCWNAALRHLDAGEASTYINLVPVVTVLSAALLLGERPAPAQLLGGALVIVGVCLAKG